MCKLCALSSDLGRHTKRVAVAGAARLSRAALPESPPTLSCAYQRIPHRQM